ncbi:hypothetical protein [Bifidobacterium myosotis]|uniref:Uncharacterized protein n=1 Tax=Bifidobacterium myosotis TaxID=1630166 RepID=A0A5M9ZI05_9BIFI|nr:hypothetical protein [Bifidobacterium myosotis]KAA8827244.1 hypothetical protein EMO91_09365 [Bifidobacterium myosotis]
MAASPVEMVHTTGYTEPQDDQSWLINRMADGIREGQLDLSLFTGDNENTYFASIDPDDFNAWLKSGIPVAKVTDTGLYGPYDPDATDGRQLKVAGFLESQLHVVFTRSGFEDQYPVVGIRYMAVIDRGNLPVVPADGTEYEGLILEYDKAEGSEVRVLAPAATGGSTTAPTIADGAVTTAKLAEKAVTAEKIADGVIPAVPDWTTLGKKPAAAAAIPDLTAAPTQADVNKILAALRTWGIVASK